MGASSGPSMQAQSYRSAIQGTYGIASYNIGVVNVNLSRQLEQITKKIIQTTSTQRAQAGSTGLAVGSKSFQMIQRAGIDEFLNTANDVRENAEIERQKIWYEAQLEANALENRARAAEEAGNRQRQQQFASLTQSVTKGFGSLFG